MPRYRQIADVFNYMTPVSADQTGQRSLVDRVGYKERLSRAVFQEGVLVISGYSSIGKTTLINLTTARRELSKANAPFTAVVSVLVDNLSDGAVCEGIYNGISKYTSGKKLDAPTPTNLAEVVHTNQLLLIVDAVNCLYDSPLSSKDLFNLCKIWTDLPRGTQVQSKIILVGSGLPGRVSQWLSQAASGKRLPREQIIISPWSSEDLLRIIDVGSRHLGIAFDLDLQRWMTKVACGLPSTMTLLAALSARRANNERDDLLSGSALRVDLSDLYGVFGESSKFRLVLYYDDRIQTLSVPSLFALYLLGINGGGMTEGEIYEHLELYGFAKDDISTELEGLIFVEKKEETIFWNINELSYATFAFLRLYFRSKLSDSDAEGINRVLNLLSEVEPPNQSETEANKTLIDLQGGSGMISILFLAADPTDASRLRLGEEFREIQEKLKLSKLRDRFKLELPQLSVRPADISQAMLDIQPQIVHFSGHGTSTGVLCFENQVGETHLIQPDALAALFEQFANQVGCVLLNACYAETQARAIAQHIEYVIGMNQAISDKAAIAFSIGFYQALGAGRTIDEAYKLGCVQIGLQGIPGHLIPILIKKGQVQP